MQLVVVRADLNGHLKALKDYFLLAKGDFFQVSLFRVRTHMGDCFKLLGSVAFLQPCSYQVLCFA